MIMLLQLHFLLMAGILFLDLITGQSEWDAQTIQNVMDPLNCCGGSVTPVSFSSDHRHIVSGAGHQMWDAQTGQKIMDSSPVSCFSTCSTSTIPPVLPILPEHFKDGNSINMSNSYKTFYCCSYDLSLLKFCYRYGNWIMLPDNAHLLWMPDQNKSGLFWPRTTTVIGCTPTSLQFKNFVHGTNWDQCFSSLLNPI